MRGLALERGHTSLRVVTSGLHKRQIYRHVKDRREAILVQNL